MAPLRFRSWHKTEKRMFRPSKMIFNLGDGELNNVREGIEGEPIIGNDAIVMQSTGLYDKNGKEIFEGDIVKWSTGESTVVEWSDGDADFIGEIEYHKVTGLASFGGFDTGPILNGFSSSKTPYYEIIGNIYEDPELLQ